MTVLENSAITFNLDRRSPILPLFSGNLPPALPRSTLEHLREGKFVAQLGPQTSGDTITSKSVASFTLAAKLAEGERVGDGSSLQGNDCDSAPFDHSLGRRLKLVDPRCRVFAQCFVLGLVGEG